MMPGSWQLLKGVLIIAIIIIAASLLAWFIEHYTGVAIIIVSIIALAAGVFIVIMISENLYKLFDSWWGGPPTAST